MSSTALPREKMLSGDSSQTSSQTRRRSLTTVSSSSSSSSSRKTNVHHLIKNFNLQSASERRNEPSTKLLQSGSGSGSGSGGGESKQHAVRMHRAVSEDEIVRVVCRGWMLKRGEGKGLFGSSKFVRIFLSFSSLLLSFSLFYFFLELL